MTVKDPNELNVENDLPVTDAPVIQSQIEPVIPAAEELNSTPAPSVMNDPGPDLDAPYGRNKDGSPAKKRGRKGGTQDDLFERLDSVTPNPPRPQKIAQSASPAVIVADYQAIAETAANLFFNVPQMLFGEDWEPEKHEVPPVVKGFKDYVSSKGITQLDPTLALCLILGSYTVGKINKPTVRTRFQSITDWIKSKVIRT